VSGKTVEDRPAIKKVKELAEANKFDCLAFTKLDRVGRSLRKLENFWKLMEEDLGLQLHCIHQPEINGKMGKMMRQLLGIFAEFERDIMLDRTKRGQLENWQDGKSQCGKLPLGYKWEKDGIVIYPNEAPIVLTIFSKYIDEHLCQADVALYLTEQGYPTRSGSNRWSASSVGHALKNPAYKGGTIIYNRYDSEGNEKPEAEWVHVTFPALISADRWNQAQERIRLNKKKPKKKYYNEYKDRFICNDVLWCGEDGSKIIRRLNKENGKFRPLYVCDTKNRSAKNLEMQGKKRCILKAVNADWVDENVWFEVKTLLSDPNNFIKQWLKDPDREQLEKDYNRIKAAVLDLEKKIERNTKELFDLTGAPRKQMKAQLSRAGKELDSKRHKLAELQSEREFYSRKEDKLREFEKAISSLRASPNLSDRYKEIRYRDSFKAEIWNHLDDLPAKDKKRIIEAVVKPEAGGKIEVRYVTGDDLVDDDDFRKYTKKQLARPLTDRPPVLEFDLKVDVNGIIALISSLKHVDLLNTESYGNLRLDGR
jgi:site-specific DNA recombinase